MNFIILLKKRHGCVIFTGDLLSIISVITVGYSFNAMLQ